VRLDDRLDDAEAETGAGRHPHLSLLAAEEAREEPVELRLVDTDAGVGDRDFDGLAVAPQGDGDRPAGVGLLERVGDEVVDDLPEPLAVDHRDHVVSGRRRG
jgi:hypothetical protein